jgi:N-acetyl-gamma-glutamylphosphate reductase
MTFSAVDENFTAYGLLDHRHTPEMEMVIRSRQIRLTKPQRDEAFHAQTAIGNLPNF